MVKLISFQPPSTCREPIRDAAPTREDRPGMRRASRLFVASPLKQSIPHESQYTCESLNKCRNRISPPSETLTPQIGHCLQGPWASRAQAPHWHSDGSPTNLAGGFMRWRLVIEFVIVYKKKPIKRRTWLTIAFSRVQGYVQSRALPMMPSQFRPTD